MAVESARAVPPNVIVLLADDMGYSDAGCYGGEIATPNLDRLAREGLRFTQFYNTARCWPSRAALLTGYYAQAVRRDTVPGVTSGTAGTRPPWAPLLPALLRPLGYRSYHSGKWHLDGKPLANGFDHSYSLNDHDRHFAPQWHTEDDVPLPAVKPGSGYYSTTAIADHAIKCLREHAGNHPGIPFFSLVAFTAPHFPLQAERADIAPYRERYLAGWDELRDRRWERMHALGIGGTSLAAIERRLGPPYDYPDDIRLLGPNEVAMPVAWDGLVASQREFQAAKMAVHAAMVDRMDKEIGRIIDQLRAMGAYDNTLVLFLSDNGASAEMMVRGDGNNPDAECGTGATFLSLGPGWSSLANTPFRRHKTWVHEGGISTPFIAHWPDGIGARGELRHSPAHIVDIVPTVLEIAGGDRTAVTAGMPSPPAPGRSLAPLFLRDGTMAHEFLWWSHEGNRALRAGDWKLVAAGTNSPWELYDLASDRAESRNLADTHPEKVRELAALWTRQTELNHSLAKPEPPGVPAGWTHQGSIHLLTTPDGADLPATAVEHDFPALVRLDADGFDFHQAQPHGEDLRFTTANGTPLAHQIEEWDAVRGTASIWVRIPEIRGKADQEIRMLWGNPSATNVSDGGSVFNSSNGYASVWHMNGPVRDEVGSVSSTDEGTTRTDGMIGEGRHLAGGQGIFAGDAITNYPSGTGPMTTEAWFRPARPNTTVMAWGKEQRPGKVMMQIASPPRVAIRCYFADVEGHSPIALGEWRHVVHTYQSKDSRVYVDGRLDGASRPLLDLPRTSALWLGGWYGNYDFVGDLDEVRLSRVVRSPDWIRLQYENQKPNQTLVGRLVGPGTAFSTSVDRLTLPEGGRAVVSAEAGGAEKVYWIIQGQGRSTTVATDRLRFVVDAGRVTGGDSFTLQFKGVYPDGVRTKDIPVTITEGIPDPVFTLEAPARWDGRQRVEIRPRISNRAAMAAKGGGQINCRWSYTGPALIQEESPERLVLLRAQGSGELTVTATLDNGGAPVSRSASIRIAEPSSDPWVQRAPDSVETPMDNQFIAREKGDEGTLFYRGLLAAPAKEVFLKTYAGDALWKTIRHKTGPGRNYSFSLRLKAGLVKYRLEFGTVSNGRETVLRSVTNLVCGDAYLIDGQSNAEATAFGDADYGFTSDWIRSFGSAAGDPEHARMVRWGRATARAQDGELQVGYWGMELARLLVERQKVPVCILNGAVGGTRIDQHQRNRSDPEDVGTIYGRLLWRVRQAGLTHGIRGVLWHQGENDQGADGPSGRYGWETYRDDFISMAAAWKQDYPNLGHYYLFQIWPKACAMGVDGSDNRLREVQRALPRAFSHMGIMSTLGIVPPGTCHYPPEGYAEIARLICPLVERDNHHAVPAVSITPPDLMRARFTGGQSAEIVLEFDQPLQPNPGVAAEFVLDGRRDRIAGAEVRGNRVTLALKQPGAVRTISYVDGAAWHQENLLRGVNGIAALTFHEVPVEAGP